MRLGGRTALVTGAGRGIGAAIAERLAREGAAVAVNDLVPQRAEATAERLIALGAVAVAIPGDVSTPQGANGIVDCATERLGGFGLLVNNAGIEHRRPLRDCTDEAWQRVLDVNLSGPFYVIRRAADRLVASGHGAIVNLCSLAVIGIGGQAAYDASKGGLQALTRGLAVELGREGVRVNAVCPGLVETPLLEETLGSEMERAAARERVARLPVGRMGAPRDVAGAVAWLLSDDAAYVTGHSLFVDGGWVRR